MVQRVTSEPIWRKSTWSDQGSCVEVAGRRGVMIRDSKHPERGVLVLSRSAWRHLVRGVKSAG